MRIVLQRVQSASVTTIGEGREGALVVSKIGPGILALVGLHKHDTEDDLQQCCRKLLACKLWSNDSGAAWRLGVKQKGYEISLVSQFTLYGTLSKKSQPDYKLAMKTEAAQVMWNQFVEMVRTNYDPNKVFDGVFGAMMNVQLINDGPVTLVIESSPHNSELIDNHLRTENDTESANR